MHPLASTDFLVRRDDLGWTLATYDEVGHLTAAGLDVTEHRGERRARG